MYIHKAFTIGTKCNMVIKYIRNTSASCFQVYLAYKLQCNGVFTEFISEGVRTGSALW